MGRRNQQEAAVEKKSLDIKVDGESQARPSVPVTLHDYIEQIKSGELDIDDEIEKLSTRGDVKTNKSYVAIAMMIAGQKTLHCEPDNTKAGGLGYDTSALANKMADALRDNGGSMPYDDMQEAVLDEIMAEIEERVEEDPRFGYSMRTQEVTYEGRGD